MPDLPTFPIATLAVEAWPDPVIDAVGHDVRSPYVERFWSGLLGPSATWLLRRLVGGLDEHPDGLQLDLALTATELGLGTRSGRALAVLPVDRALLPLRGRPTGR